MLTTDQMVPKTTFVHFTVIMQQLDKAALSIPEVMLRWSCTHQQDADLSVHVALCHFRVVRERTGLLVSNS